MYNVLLAYQWSEINFEKRVCRSRQVRQASVTTPTSIFSSSRHSASCTRFSLLASRNCPQRALYSSTCPPTAARVSAKIPMTVSGMLVNLCISRHLEHTAVSCMTCVSCSCLWQRRRGDEQSEGGGADNWQGQEACRIEGCALVRTDD